MRWEELSVPEIEALDRDRTVVILPLGSVEQHGRHMPVGTDTLLAMRSRARSRGPPRGAASPCCRRPGTDSPPHHMRFAGHGHASRRDDDGACRRHRRQRHRAWFPTVSDRQRPWRQQRRHRRARLDARPPALRKGADRRPHLFPARARRDRGAARIATRRHGPRLRVRDRDDAASCGPTWWRWTSAAVTYPDPGSRYLTTDLLGGSAVRTYHDFGDLSESGTLGDPSLATAEKGAALLRRRGRRARPLHRGLFRTGRSRTQRAPALRGGKP